MKLFLLSILCLISGVTVAQSNLPACQGNEMSKWNNCFGFHVKTGDHMNYGFFTNNSKYVGEYKEGLPEGKGVLTDNYNSHKYEGTFTNGKLEGQGVRYDNAGTKFEGEFVDGKPKRGTYIHKDGSKIVGEYWGGSWRGQYMRISPSGEIIQQGTFVNKIFGGVTFEQLDTDAHIQKRNAEIERLRIDTSSGASTKPETKPTISLIWPSNGQILSKFDSNKKGIQIAGVLGSPVVAAANGRVVFANNTLKGYGNLIILKHDNTYLTTYAHNSKLLVKEGDTVRQGEKIAELGNTDSTEPKLQFEVRENGKSVDPELFLNRQVVVERPQDKIEITPSAAPSQQVEKLLPQCQGDRAYWTNCIGAVWFGASSYSDMYVGEWLDGKMHGFGKFSSPKPLLEHSIESFPSITLSAQGFEYIGEFKNNQRNGFGVMSFKNGDKYIGFWSADKRHGRGIQRYADGRIAIKKEGVWNLGSFSREESVLSNLEQFIEIFNREPFQYIKSLSYDPTNRTDNLTNATVINPATSAITPSVVSNTPQSSQTFPAVNFGKRLALVIGNASYKVRPLLNPRNDADDVSRVLRSTGFEVIDLRDASLPQMRAGVRQFGERLMSNDVGLVYYSGHGIEVKGRNYFIPINADIKASDEVADQALDVSLILAKMDTAKKGVNILIVDACRDDPFGRSFRSNSRGLATMDAPQGTLIAYATAPGSVAADGTGRNSPFTKHLVRAMQVPNTPIELMFKEVRRAVREETKNQQTPWENSSLIGNFYFSVKK